MYLPFIFRFGRFHEDISLRAFHSLYPFHLSISFTSLSLSPLYPFHLSISFNSLSLSPLNPFHLSLSLSLSLIYLSVPLYISPSTFLFLSLLPSLFSLSFSLAFLMDIFVLVFFVIPERKIQAKPYSTLGGKKLPPPHQFLLNNFFLQK